VTPGGTSVAAYYICIARVRLFKDCPKSKGKEKGKKPGGKPRGGRNQSTLAAIEALAARLDSLPTLAAVDESGTVRESGTERPAVLGPE